MCYVARNCTEEKLGRSAEYSAVPTCCVRSLSLPQVIRHFQVITISATTTVQAATENTLRDIAKSAEGKCEASGEDPVTDTVC